MYKQNRHILMFPNYLQKASLKKLLTAFVFCFVFLWGTGPCLGARIQDKKSRIIDFEKPFSRIISLYGAHTENLFHMELDQEIIGVSVNDAFPEKANTKERFSYHDDAEKFLGKKPDLVLIRPMIDNGYPKFINSLEKFGITVVSLQPSNIQEMYEYWKNLGLLTGKTKAANEMIASFKDSIKEIRALTAPIQPKKQVYFQAIHKRMKTFTPTSMPIFALETAGGINIASDAKASRNTNIAIYGKEQILAKANQIDVFLAQKGVMNAVHLGQIKMEPGFKIIKAVKNNQVYLIDENIVSRPVPRLLQGVLQIGKLLYPDVFNQLVIN
ncbi:MAG: ABC transporter substrate-binding protein [Desulfobacteraceae bacterium]|nr:ABC transporter substrate-binding protein [Desulfobacteraceae bacterium]